MKVTASQQQKIREWGLIELAQQRLFRCKAQSDWIGVAYNERMIAKYKRMLLEHPVPNAPPIPGAIP